MDVKIPHLVRPAYAQSGWPEGLVQIALEAQRRFEIGELTADEYYFSNVQIAGLSMAKRGGN